MQMLSRVLRVHICLFESFFTISQERWTILFKTVICILMEISQGIQIMHSQFCRSCGSWVTVKYVSFWKCFIFWHTRPTCSNVQYLYFFQPVQQNPYVIVCAAIVNCDKIPKIFKKWLTGQRPLKKQVCFL